MIDKTMEYNGKTRISKILNKNYKKLNHNTRITLNFQGRTTNYINPNKGEHQGYCFSPLLFNIHNDDDIRKWKSTSKGIYIDYHMTLITKNEKEFQEQYTN